MKGAVVVWVRLKGNFESKVVIGELCNPEPQNG